MEETLTIAEEVLQVEVVRQPASIVVAVEVAIRVRVWDTNTIHTVIEKTPVHPVMEVGVALTAGELVGRDSSKKKTIRIL